MSVGKCQCHRCSSLKFDCKVRTVGQSYLQGSWAFWGSLSDTGVHTGKGKSNSDILILGATSWHGEPNDYVT
jgi:hypothetical protein